MTSAKVRPCRTPYGAHNINVCVAEGCFNQACVTEEAGVWVSYSYDMGPSDVRPHADEMTALRVINNQGYGSVIFLRFGEDVREAEQRQKEKRE